MKSQEILQNTISVLMRIADGEIISKDEAIEVGIRLHNLMISQRVSPPPIQPIEEAAELKPCPFCGANPEKIFIGNDYTKKRSVEIKCPGCFTKQVTGAIRNDHAWCDKVATGKWNTRTVNN